MHTSKTTIWNFEISYHNMVLWSKSWLLPSLLLICLQRPRSVLIPFTDSPRLTRPTQSTKCKGTPSKTPGTCHTRSRRSSDGLEGHLLVEVLSDDKKNPHEDPAVPPMLLCLLWMQETRTDCGRLNSGNCIASFMKGVSWKNSSHSYEERSIWLCDSHTFFWRQHNAGAAGWS